MSGRVAIVTGGSGGIGAAVAHSFAMAGAAVLIVGRTGARLAAAEGRLREVTRPDAVLALEGDVRREEDMAAVAGAAVARWGRIDVLVTCAGVDARVRAVPDPVATLPISSWQAVIDTNLRGTFLAVRAVLPTMFAQHRGDVLTVSSAPAGLHGQALAAAYCASKFGVCALSEALAEEVRGKGVRVQMLVPGLVDTPLVQGSTLSTRLGPPLPPDRVGAMARALVTLPDEVTVPPVRRHGLAVLRHVRAPGRVAEEPRPARAPAREVRG
jgi:NAD(P)-dependent dehydrogenase (short-subunit alcohol dehydrogenase family)